MERGSPPGKGGDGGKRAGPGASAIFPQDFLFLIFCQASTALKTASYQPELISLYKTFLRSFNVSTILDL